MAVEYRCVWAVYFVSADAPNETRRITAIGDAGVVAPMTKEVARDVVAELTKKWRVVKVWHQFETVAA